jgi:hypothetical protein
MNKYLFELTPYLPARQTNVNKKLDKISILKLTNEHIKYLKSKSNNAVNNATPAPDDSIWCEYATDRELEALMFDSNNMDGFLMIVKCDTNRIVQVSESCAKYIGFSAVSKDDSDPFCLQTMSFDSFLFTEEPVGSAVFGSCTSARPAVRQGSTEQQQQQQHDTCIIL